MQGSPSRLRDGVPRSMVEGASEKTLRCGCKASSDTNAYLKLMRCVTASAPSTTLRAVPLPRFHGGGKINYSAACFGAGRGSRSRNAGRISSAIAVMLARAISLGSVPNWVLVSEVLKPARS